MILNPYKDNGIVFMVKDKEYCTMKNTNEREIMHPRTVWRFIKDDIEIKIIKGELRNADKVPSISELASIYDVSKTTAQKALEDMYNEGTITKRKGIGYFVKPYNKERLRTKHIKELTVMFNNCFEYASRLELSSKEIDVLKSKITKSIDDLSSP